MTSDERKNSLSEGWLVRLHVLAAQNVTDLASRDENSAPCHCYCSSRLGQQIAQVSDALIVGPPQPFLPPARCSVSYAEVFSSLSSPFTLPLLAPVWSRVSAPLPSSRLSTQLPAWKLLFHSHLSTQLQHSPENPSQTADSRHTHRLQPWIRFVDLPNSL